MNWILDNWLILLPALYTLLSVIVGITETPKDDAILKVVRDLLIRFSFLQPSDAEGTMKVPGTKVKR